MFLSPVNALNGDIGILTNHDVVALFSLLEQYPNRVEIVQFDDSNGEIHSDPKLSNLLCSPACELSAPSLLCSNAADDPGITVVIHSSSFFIPLKLHRNFRSSRGPRFLHLPSAFSRANWWTSERSLWLPLLGFAPLPSSFVT